MYGWAESLGLLKRPTPVVIVAGCKNTLSKFSRKLNEKIVDEATPIVTSIEFENVKYLESRFPFQWMNCLTFQHPLCDVVTASWHVEKVDNFMSSLGKNAFSSSK